VAVGIATLLALAVNFTIAALWYHPRPFELGIGHQLIEHAVATSFPSDHGTPALAPDSVLIEVHAASLNPIDNILRAGYLPIGFAAHLLGCICREAARIATVGAALSTVSATKSEVG
jgi:hypothetical protein